MSGNKRRGLIVVLVSVLAVGLATRLFHRVPAARTPARAPERAPRGEFVHPVIPSAPIVKPAVAPCRGRDLHDLVGAVRESTKKLPPFLEGAKADGAPATCRAEPANGRWTAMVDVFSRDASRCVALDSELDSQWNQVQSAVMALDACVDCTRPRPARATSCARARELLDAADQATPR
ncbi:MAG TPA: hypothetical protein VHO06_00965 [Polyangia bacterium]|nr:hypothetical protein [Polyangia bacterium]